MGDSAGRVPLSYADRDVYYVCHPVAPTEADLAALHPVARSAANATTVNVQRALRWLRWLRRSFPESTFIMPWAVDLLSGADDSDPAQREAGLVDCEAVAHLVGSVVMVGGRIGKGGRREMAAATFHYDLTDLGTEPPAVVDGVGFNEWFLGRRSAK